MDIPVTNPQREDRPLWHRPQVRRLALAQATAGVKPKEGSTEDFFTHANTWPSGVPFPR